MGISTDQLVGYIEEESKRLSSEISETNNKNQNEATKILSQLTKAVIKEVKQTLGNDGLNTIQQRELLRGKANQIIGRKKRIFRKANPLDGSTAYPIQDAIDIICQKLDDGTYTFEDEAFSENEPKVNKTPKINKTEQFFSECRSIGAEKDNELDYVSEKIYRLILIFAEDFIESLNDVEETDFEEEVSFNQINEIVNLFEWVSELLFEQILELNMNKNLDFLKVRDSVIKAISNFDYNFRFLPEETQKIFEESVLSHVIAILKDMKDVVSLTDAVATGENKLSKEKVESILLADRNKCLEECTDAEKNELYPFTDDETDFIITEYNSNEDDNGNSFEEICLSVNNQFHGGLNFRKPGDIENLIDQLRTAGEESADDAENKLSDKDDDEVDDMLSDTGTDGEFSADEYTKTEITEESDSKPVEIDSVCRDVQSRLRQTVHAVEKELTDLELFDEFLKMRQGFVDKVREHHNLRNPDIYEIAAKKERLEKLIIQLRELKNEIISEVSALKSIEPATLLAAMKIKNSDTNDINLTDANFIEAWGKIQKFLELWEQIKDLLTRARDIEDEIKHIEKYISNRDNDIKKGDRFFNKTINDTALGADPLKITGESNKQLFEVNPDTKKLIELSNSSLHTARKLIQIIEGQRSQMKNDARNKIKTAYDKIKPLVEKESENSDENTEETQKETVKVLDEGIQQNITFEFRNETIELNPVQLQALLLTTQWGLKHKVWGLRVDKDHLNIYLSELFDCEQMDRNDLADELRPVTEKVEGIRSKPPKKNMRAESQKLFLEWNYRYKSAKSSSTWFLPTHLAYEFVEALPEEYKLSVEQTTKLNTLKEKEKEERMKTNQLWKKRFNKSEK